MKKLFVFTMALCGLMLFSTSCKDKKFKGFDQTKDGLYYKFTAKYPDARAPQKGDYLFLTVSFRTDNDSLVFEEREVLDMLQDPIYPGDLNDAYGMMHEGEEAVFALKADTFMHYAGYHEIPSFVNENTMVFFTIKMTQIRTAEEIDAEKEEEIKQYMQKHELQGEPTESGLYYIEKEAGKGNTLVAGDSVSILYTFRLANDSIFDSSEGKSPLYCIVGQMFSGLNEGLSKMKRGGKATLIMPYKIAFGVQNPYVPVPPFATIVADIEVLPNIVRQAPAPVPDVMD